MEMDLSYEEVVETMCKDFELHMRKTTESENAKKWILPMVRKMAKICDSHIDDSFDDICTKCGKLIDGCYGGCLACDLDDLDDEESQSA